MGIAPSSIVDRMASWEGEREKEAWTDAMLVFYGLITAAPHGPGLSPPNALYILQLSGAATVVMRRKCTDVRESYKGYV